MSDLPRISIITPSYNQGAFIEQTIRSIKAQTYGRYEHIVVDGGSISVERVMQFQPEFSYIGVHEDKAAAGKKK